MLDTKKIEKLSQSVALLNVKILKIYKERSGRDINGKTIEYRNNVTKDRILDFLHQDRETARSEDDELPCMKEYGLFDFWKFINKD